jgi:methyl-accepting chemotaxis protein
MAVRDAAQSAASGLDQVVDQAVANHDWTREISHSAQDVRGLIEGIAKRGTDLAAGTEDVAAAAEEIAAAAEQLNASTGEIAASATRLAEASVRLTGEIGKFQLDGRSDRLTVNGPSARPPVSPSPSGLAPGPQTVAAPSTAAG